jgi:PAS domain S-box-containing protein
MSWQYTPYVLPLVAAAVITTLLAVSALRRRPQLGATPFAWLMVIVTLWLLCYGMEVGGADLQTILFWTNAKFLSVAFLPVMWLAFALQYSGQERWLTRRNVSLLSVVPLVTQVVIWTNAAHSLFRYDSKLETNGSFLTLQSTPGAYFWVHTAYSYLLIGLGLVLLMRALIRAPRVYRGQAATLLAGAVVPLAANVVYIFRFQQTLPLDPTPFCFMVTGLAFAWGLFRYRLLDVVPAARTAVVEGMSDGVIVLNTQNLVEDLNPAAQRILARTATQAVGQPVERILSVRPDLVEHYRNVTEVQAEITLEVDKRQRFYDMRLTPLYDRRRGLTGRLVVLHDITDRKRAEETLRRWVAQLQVIPEVAHAIVATGGLDDLLTHSVNSIQERFEFYHAGIFLMDEQGEYADLRAATSATGRQMLQRGYRLKAGQASVVGFALSNGQFCIGPKVGADADHFGNPLFPQTRSEIALPLKVGQRVVGALDVHSVQEAAFNEATIAVLQTVADLLAVAIENARLLQEMQGTVREMEKTYGQYTEEAWRSLARSAGRPRGYRYQYRAVEPVSGLHPEAQQAWQQGHPIVTTVQPETQDGKSDTLGALAVPITLRDQVIGALNLRFEDKVPPETVALVQEVTGRLALALENARLLEDTQRRAAREQLTREITDNIRAAVSVEDAMQRAAGQLARALGAAEVVTRIGTEGELLAERGGLGNGDSNTPGGQA